MSDPEPLTKTLLILCIQYIDEAFFHSFNFQVCNKIIFLISFVGNRGTFTRGYKAMVMDFEFLYHLLYLIICSLGVFVHVFFYSLLVRERDTHTQNLFRLGEDGSDTLSSCPSRSGVEPPSFISYHLFHHWSFQGQSFFKDLYSKYVPGHYCVEKVFGHYSFFFFFFTQFHCH